MFCSEDFVESWERNQVKVAWELNSAEVSFPAMFTLQPRRTCQSCLTSTCVSTIGRKGNS